MTTGVIGELGVEGRAQDSTLENPDDLTFEFADDLNIGADPGDDRGPDKHSSHRTIGSDHVYLCLETMDLRPKGVATDRDVEQTKPILVVIFDLACQQDHSHTSAPNRHALGGGLLNGYPKTKPVHEFSNGRALAAGQNESIHASEVFWVSHKTNVSIRSSSADGLCVQRIVTLDRYDTDSLGRHDGQGEKSVPGTLNADG